MHQDDLERRLSNWARWYFSGGRATLRTTARISSVYNLGARGRRADVSMPVIDGEAIDTHDAIERLAPDLRDVLRARYLRLTPNGRSLAGLTQRQIARQLKFSEVTLWRRLVAARQALAGLLTAHRRRHVGQQHPARGG